jgi:hypothetical protein
MSADTRYTYRKERQLRKGIQGFLCALCGLCGEFRWQSVNEL